MTLIQPDNVEELRLRRERMLLEAEERMEAAVGAAIRGLLRRIVAAWDDSVRTASLAAAAGNPFDDSPYRWMGRLGEIRGWWEAELDDHVTSAVGSLWRAGYMDTRDGVLLDSSMQASGEYLARVSDRLSRTATPTIPDQAMDIARVGLADEMARGSSIDTIGRRIAQDFSWDQDASLSRDRLSEVTERLDGILDGYGPVGSKEREDVRMGRVLDPDVARLQDERSSLVVDIDRVESTWEVRAERIARTETTGAYNAGSMQGARDEGDSANYKVWIATADDRTRDSHLEAHGSCATLRAAFDVGGASVDFPGDPSGPPEETINCRCTLVYAESCDEAQELYGRMDELIDEERERRDESPAEDAVPDPVAPPDEDEVEDTGAGRYELREDGLEHYDGLDLSGDPEYRLMDGWEDDVEMQDLWKAVDDPTRASDGDLNLNLPADRQDAARGAVQKYQGGDYEKMNNALRFEPDRLDSRLVPPVESADVNTVRKAVRHLDEAVEAAPRVSEPLTTYRGIGSDYAREVASAPVGSVLSDKGFLSTSLSRQKAFDSFGYNGRVMQIEMPPGTPAIYMNAQRNTIFPGELELMAARGAQMEVVSQTAETTVVRIVGFARDVVEDAIG